MKEAAVKRHGMEEKKKKSNEPAQFQLRRKEIQKKNLYMPDKTVRSYVSAESNL